MPKPVIGYIRVSTDKQRRSGLGLEAQQEALRTYAKQTGAKVLATYTEVESGRRSDRPELAKALAHAKRSQAQLVVAKLDRLSRNVAFLAALMEAKVDFVCCDIPHANPLTIHILAAVAEEEAKAISKRTKEALAAYKARGGKLGRNNLTDSGRVKGAKRAGALQRRKAEERYADLTYVLDWHRNGMTQQQIAQRLNEEGQTTSTCRPWRQAQVSHLLKRLSRRTVAQL